MKNVEGWNICLAICLLREWRAFDQLNLLWAAPCQKVPNGQSRCHTKRRSLMAWVGVIPKEGCEAIVLLVWHRLFFWKKKWLWFFLGGGESVSYQKKDSHGSRCPSYMTTTHPSFGLTTTQRKFLMTMWTQNVWQFDNPPVGTFLHDTAHYVKQSWMKQY